MKHIFTKLTITLAINIGFLPLLNATPIPEPVAPRSFNNPHIIDFRQPVKVVHAPEVTIHHHSDPVHKTVVFHEEPGYVKTTTYESTETSPLSMGVQLLTVAAVLFFVVLCTVKQRDLAKHFRKDVKSLIKRDPYREFFTYYHTKGSNDISIENKMFGSNNKLLRLNINRPATFTGQTETYQFLQKMLKRVKNSSDMLQKLQTIHIHNGGLPKILSTTNKHLGTNLVINESSIISSEKTQLTEEVKPPISYVATEELSEFDLL